MEGWRICVEMYMNTCLYVFDGRRDTYRTFRNGFLLVYSFLLKGVVVWFEHSSRHSTRFAHNIQFHFDILWNFAQLFRLVGVYTLSYINYTTYTHSHNFHTRTHCLFFLVLVICRLRTVMMRMMCD